MKTNLDIFKTVEKQLPNLKTNLLVNLSKIYSSGKNVAEIVSVNNVYYQCAKVKSA